MDILELIGRKETLFDKDVFQYEKELSALVFKV